MIYLILINLVTPKARAKHEPYVQQTGLWGLTEWEIPWKLLDPMGTAHRFEGIF
jgi:hypothetical protein